MITRESVRGVYPVIPLEEAAEFLDHLRKPVKQSDRMEGPYPYYGANGLQGTIDDYLFNEPLVLVAEDGGHFDTPERGIAYQIEGKTWVNNHAHVLRPRANVDIRFLTRVLENYDVRPFINGSTRAKLTKGQAKNIEIPLPPLEEQKRIAEILDQADALRRLRTRALDKLNTLGQAIFHEMFGDVPNEHIKKLTDVALLINGDRSSNYPSGDDLKDEGVLFLSTKNIRDWRLVFDKVLHITEEKFASLSRGKLQRGDLVITLRGTLGQAAIFDCEFETGFINAQMMIIRPKAGISSQYLLDFLSLDSTQHELNKGQSGSAVKQLTAKQVGELPVVVPSENQQSAYGSKILAHQKCRLAAMKQLHVSEALFISLQHRAFRGEL